MGDTYCVLAALHCVQQNQGWRVLGDVCLECDVDVVCVRCAGS